MKRDTYTLHVLLYSAGGGVHTPSGGGRQIYPACPL